MYEQLQAVEIGEIAVSRDPKDILVVYGLGSCVAVLLYDPSARVGGTLHALLPTARGKSGPPARFVDQGVPLLVNALVRLGAKIERLQASLCGGACILERPIADGEFDIGRYNVLAAREALHALYISVSSSATGGRHGRTVKLHLADGQVTVRTVQHEERVLWPPAGQGRESL